MATLMSTFEDRLNALDVHLFDGILAQSTPDDKRALLALQRALRERAGGYVYLEIGSYMGGSIQPHLLDPRCDAIVSIDKRAASRADGRSTPDARGQLRPYAENSTARMLGNLRELSPEGVANVRTFDDGVEAISPGDLDVRPDACFIDGEHTDPAVLRDFDFCLAVVKRPGVIFFHDANVVFNGLQRIVARLEKEGVQFSAYVLPTSVFVIELDGIALHQDPRLTEMLVNNHRSYLPGLSSMDKYRRFCNAPVVRLLRKIARPLRPILHG